MLYCSSMRIIVADFCVFFASILGIKFASFVVLVSFMSIVILLVVVFNSVAWLFSACFFF